MLSFSTKVETLDVEIDGKKYQVPLEPTVKDVQGDAQGLFSNDQAKPEEFYKWFVGFLGHYIPHVDKLPMNALISITEEWSARSTLTKGFDAGK